MELGGRITQKQTKKNNILPQKKYVISPTVLSPLKKLFTISEKLSHTKSSTRVTKLNFLAYKKNR